MNSYSKRFTSASQKQGNDFVRDKIDRTNVYLTKSVNNHAKNQFYFLFEIEGLSGFGNAQLKSDSRDLDLRRWTMGCGLRWNYCVRREWVLSRSHGSYRLVSGLCIRWWVFNLLFAFDLETITQVTNFLWITFVWIHTEFKLQSLKTSNL